jgi:CheY-like chemotaxis protein/CRP-like cAMP-binding protein
MKRILLIEDNQEMRENTAEILELANYRVITAENGKIGVEKARNELPDLIVSDIMMPELDGYGVLYMLSKKPETASIPFIFLSAKADKEDFKKGMSYGADDYLTKPYEEKELLDAVERRLKKVEILKASVNAGKEDQLSTFLSSAGGVLELKSLLENKKVRDFSKKEMIYLEGSYPNVLYYINKGKVKCFRTNEDGKELITGMYAELQFFGHIALLSEEPYLESAMAMEDAEITIIPKDDFFALIYNNRDVAHTFIKLLSNSVKDQEERLLNTAYNSIRKRVSESLIRFYETYKGEPGKEIPVFRDDLAKVVGTSTETVIRTLSEFKDEGLIATSGRRITVLEPEKLRKLKF